MQELRLVAVSEDGSYAVLVVPGRSGRFALPIDERLRTVARGQFSRLAQYEIEVESPLRPKEIQDRIRAGETAEEIADAAGLPVDRIRRFEGPPLAERARWALEAQRATVRGRGEAGPGPRLGEVVTERLADLGALAEDMEWDSRKRQDGTWQVQLAYTLAGRLHLAEWVYDTKSSHVTPDDDEAIRLSLDQSDWPEPRPAARPPVTATVTPIGSRAAAAAHHADQRGDGDRAASRGTGHPSRPVVAAVGSGQAPPTIHARAAGGTSAPGGTGAAGSTDVAASTGGRGEVPAQAPRARGTVLTPGRDTIEQEAAGPKTGRRPDLAGDAGPPASPDHGESAVPVGAVPAATLPADAAPADAEPPAAAPATTAPVPAEAVPPATAPAQAAPASTGPADAAPAEADPPPPRPARRAAGGRSRRSSVPSWDEIMFGTSRQPD